MLIWEYLPWNRKQLFLKTTMRRKAPGVIRTAAALRFMQKRDVLIICDRINIS